MCLGIFGQKIIDITNDTADEQCLGCSAAPLTELAASAILNVVESFISGRLRAVLDGSVLPTEYLPQAIIYTFHRQAWVYTITSSRFCRKGVRLKKPVGAPKWDCGY